MVCTISPSIAAIPWCSDRAQLISRASPFPFILYPPIPPSPPRSLVLIRHVHIRGRGDAFMIIHPSYPPPIMAALDTHPLRTRHLAFGLFSLIVCITTHCLMDFLGGVVGAECQGGQATFQEFPVDADPARRHWEGPV